MLENILQKLKKIKEKKIEIILLVLIMITGSFLRLYNFSDWLHFEHDQARDLMFVSEGVTKGPADLPMLGPKASSSALRLGPAYYYMEYLSALVFGNTPTGHALFVAIFSIFSIYAMYLLLRIFFNTFISLGLTYLYSISLFFVLYSRFSWNPNILPFFVILGLYSLLKATNQKTKSPQWWFIFAVAIFTIGTQLHFIAFITLPMLVGFFLFYKKTKLTWKTWAVSLGMMLILYFPVIISEIKFKGENTKNFFYAIRNKNDAKHSLAEKIMRNVVAQSKGYALMLSGDDHIATPKAKSFLKLSSYKKPDPYGFLLVLSFFIGGLVLFIHKIYKLRNDWILMGMWFVLTFALFSILAYEMSPRFYLLIVPLPFIFLGIIIDFIWNKNKKIAKAIFIVVILALTYSNFSFIAQRFSQLSRADLEILHFPADNILKEPTRVTLNQQQQIAKFLYEKYQKNGYPIFVVYSDRYYRQSIKHLAERLGAPIVPMSDSVYLNSNSIIILRSASEKNQEISKYSKAYNIESKKEFGTLTIYSLIPKKEKITATNPETLPLAGGDSGDIKRITWRDVFGANKEKLK